MTTPSVRLDRVYHQDYIARIRYSNTLPPPPNFPKLLKIPNTGLDGGLYTSAAFTSRLTREQPLNIEADAELGMPIDLIGLPGVFEGDDTSLKGLDYIPAVHPNDRPLLRPLSMLGKASAMTTGVSFLRRTEYISSDQGRSRFESTTSKDLVRPKQDLRKRKRSELENENNPIRMLRSIIKGFDVAYPKDSYDGADSETNIRGADITLEEQDIWSNPKHPAKPEMKLLDSYPVLPDLSAFPDSGSYLVTKFITNPLAGSDIYDERLDVGLLRPLEMSQEEHAQLEAQRLAHEADASLPRPALRFDYEFFLPADQGAVNSIKTTFNVNTVNGGDSALHDDESGTGKQSFRYGRIRAYETYQQAGDPDDLFGDAIAIALHDSEGGLLDGNSKSLRSQKAAYFYPIAQRTFVRPRREDYVSAGVIAQGMAFQRAETRIDYLDVVIREPDETESTRRESHRATYDSVLMADDSH